MNFFPSYKWLVSSSSISLLSLLMLHDTASPSFDLPPHSIHYYDEDKNYLSTTFSICTGYSVMGILLGHSDKFFLRRILNFFLSFCLFFGSFFHFARDGSSRNLLKRLDIFHRRDLVILWGSSNRKNMEITNWIDLRYPMRRWELYKYFSNRFSFKTLSDFHF